MAVSGKQFEEKFRRDWKKTFPGGDIERLPDQVSGYKEFSRNTSDFICYNFPLLFYIECKCHAGASMPLSAIPQSDRLIKKIGIQGVRAGVVLFLYEKKQVFYIPATTLKKLLNDGKKSVGLKTVEEGYDIIEIPSKMLRAFMDSDYSCLMDLPEMEIGS